MYKQISQQYATSKTSSATGLAWFGEFWNRLQHADELKERTAELKWTISHDQSHATLLSLALIFKEQKTKTTQTSVGNRQRMETWTVCPPEA